MATGGGVSGGEVVVLEDFRLRRLLATLLGVDLADEDDPLLPGLQVSGNSVVGDTLVLGDQARAELMALYREEATSETEDQAIADFYGRLAHRATVLVHREVDEVDIGLIRRIVALESPAHVQVRVATASWPFMVGVASLVGVDTYLARAVPPRPVRVQRSVLGGGDFVLGPTTLDPRLRGEAAPPPVGVCPTARPFLAAENHDPARSDPMTSTANTATTFSTADPLTRQPLGERPVYATGMLLDAQDFQDEQTYHRSQLARALGAVAGSGTLAGLAGAAPPCGGHRARFGSGRNPGQRRPRGGPAGPPHRAAAPGLPALAALVGRRGRAQHPAAGRLHVARSVHFGARAGRCGAARACRGGRRVPALRGLSARPHAGLCQRTRLTR